MDDRTELVEAEAQLRAAMLDSDVDKLDRLLSDTTVFIDQNGQRLTKGDDLAVHCAGLLAIETIEVRGEPDVRPLGDVAIVHVTVDLAGAYDGQSFAGAFAYSRVWRRTEAGWRVEAAHCSAVPDQQAR